MRCKEDKNVPISLGQYSSMDINHMPSKVWYEITYPLPNFNSYTIEV